MIGNKIQTVLEYGILMEVVILNLLFAVRMEIKRNKNKESMVGHKTTRRPMWEQK